MEHNNQDPIENETNASESRYSSVVSLPGTEPLWTVVEVASYLRLEPETIRAMARRGELPSLKLGKRVWRFKPNEVKNWLNMHQAE